MDRLDFIESEARANAAFHLACAEALERQSNALLILLLAGAGASLGYVVKLANEKSATWLLAGLCAATVYLFAVAAITTWKCLWSREMYPAANEPKNLDQPEFDIDAIRSIEIKNRQTCIDFNRDRNDRVGSWLNKCRLLAAATPLIFSVVVWVLYR